MSDPVELEAAKRQGWQISKYRPVAPTKENPNYNNALGFHQSQAQVRLILGANRSGKTQAVLAELAAVALGPPYPWWFNWKADLPPPLTIWIVRPHFPANPGEDAVIKKLFRGEHYLSRDKRWIWAEPLIPPGMVRWNNTEWTEVILINGTTISIRSTNQKDLAFASNQVDFIVVDEPTESNKWRELVSRMVAVPHARLVHGLTDIYDTTDYLDQMIDTEDTDLDFDKFDFTTAGNPHTDKEHAERTFKFQTREQRLVTEMGMRSPASKSKTLSSPSRLIRTPWRSNTAVSGGKY